MSATTTAALQIKVYPPPPTSNALDPKQRSRLLRSARKLEALLGETPILLEAESDESTAESTPLPTSTSSKVNDPSWDASSYIHVPSSGPSAPYQVQAIWDDHSPSSSRSSSPCPASHQQHPKRQKQMAPRTDDRQHATKSKGGSHPLLLRLRPRTADGSNPNHDSSPVRSNNRDGVLNFNIPVIPPFSPVSTSFSQPQDTSDVTSAIGSTDASLPPSPCSAVFTSPIPPNQQSLTDREKRRKMAKLARTLGENIPPELVFHSGNKNKDEQRGSGAGTGLPNPAAHHPIQQAPSSLSRSTSLGFKAFRRDASTTGNGNGHKLTKSIGGVGAANTGATRMGDPLPILPVAETPVPTSPSGRPGSSSSSSGATPKRKRPTSPPSALADNASSTSPVLPGSPDEESSTPRTTSTTRRHRPRSLTLGTLSAFASPALMAATKHAHSNEHHANAMGQSGSSPSLATSPSSSTSPTKSHSNSIATRRFGFGRTRGTNSLDSPRDTMPALPPPPPPVPIIVHPGMRKDQPFALIFDPSPSRDSVDSLTRTSEDPHENSVDDSHHAAGRSQGNLDVNEWDGRRKEREWSGEWNVKDMERVARALRELRGR